MTWPLFIRKLRAKYGKKLPATAPVVGALEHAKSRLAHQEKQLEKWNGRLKYGTFGDPDKPNFMSRVEIKKMRDDVAAKIPYWQDKVLEAENGR